MDSENSKSKSWWTTLPGIITAIAALITATGGLIVILNSTGCLKHEPVNPNNINEPVISTKNLNPSKSIIINYDSLATAMSAQWYENTKSNNIDGLVTLVSVPFYADNQILTSLSEVREFYNKILREKGEGSTMPALTELKIYKASELRNKGFDITKDRFFQSMQFEPDPYIALLGFSGEYVEVIFRKVDQSLKIAGIWD